MERITDVQGSEIQTEHAKDLLEYLRLRKLEDDTKTLITKQQARVIEILKTNPNLKTVWSPSYLHRVTLTEKSEITFDMERLEEFLKMKNLYESCLLKSVRKDSVTVELLEKYLPEQELNNVLESNFNDDLFFDLIAKDKLALDDVKDMITQKPKYGLQRAKQTAEAEADRLKRLSEEKEQVNFVL